MFARHLGYRLSCHFYNIQYGLRLNQISCIYFLLYKAKQVVVAEAFLQARLPVSSITLGHDKIRMQYAGRFDGIMHSLHFGFIDILGKSLLEKNNRNKADRSFFMLVGLDKIALVL
ncbi:MAG: hypothetical protein IPO53_13695 [Chitinophagaceae bacterium]|nr:hypothetical protein [Chitinophagaceae bacterium]